MAGKPEFENRNEAVLTAIVLTFMSALMARGVLGQSTTSDGLIYASIARNLADGLGSFWNPRFSATFFSDFHEHPPLAMWLESGLFRLFGDHFWVERVFSTLCFVVLLTVLARLWRHSGGARSWPAWPFLFLALMPQAYRMIDDHYLELPLAAFAGLSVWAQLEWLKATGTGRSLAWGLLAWLGLLAAFLVKGPVGLFPLAVMPLYALTRPAGVRRWLPRLLVLLGLCAVTAVLLWLNETSRQSLGAYVSSQIFSSLGGERSAYVPRNVSSLVGALGLQSLVQGRSFVLAVLLLNLIPGALLLITTRLVTRGGQNPGLRNPRWAAFYLLLGLSASLPLMLSPRQFSHYLFPSLPWFALALAHAGEPWLAPAWARTCARRRGPVLARALLASLLVALAAQAIRHHGRIGSHEREITVADRLDVLLGAESRLALCPGLHDDIRLIAYLQRRAGISVERQSAPALGTGWLLCTAPPTAGQAPDSWQPLPFDPAWALWRAPAGSAQPMP